MAKKHSEMSLLGALLAAVLLIGGCDQAQSGKDNIPDIPVAGGVETPETEIGPVFPPPPDANPLGILQVVVRTDPAEPQNERFLDDWRFKIFNIDDQARLMSQIYYGETRLDGTADLLLPADMLAGPIVIQAYNDVYPPQKSRNKYRYDFDVADEGEGEEILGEEDVANGGGRRHKRDDFGECKQFEIFIPANCYDRAVWMVGPFEDALWDYYKQAARYRGESWNPSQVDCETWKMGMQLLLGTKDITDALNDLSNTRDQIFDDEALIHALQRNQEFLVPTRPPICMAERRHNGGGLERAEKIYCEDNDLFTEGAEVADEGAENLRHHCIFKLDDKEIRKHDVVNVADYDPVYVGKDGIVKKICGVDLADRESLEVNGELFIPDENYELDEEDFIGTVHDEINIVELMDVTVYNVRQTNGREIDDFKYDDACSVTELIEFTNKDDDERDVFANTGVTFYNLFDELDARVHLTSDGDRVVDDNDTWVIFKAREETLDANGGNFGRDHDRDPCVDGKCGKDRRRHYKVLSFELLGFRSEDFRDVLHMTYNEETEDFFLGLRADYELNEEEVDGERAFVGFTVTAWDGTNDRGRLAVRDNIANCYDAADIWARQFFITQYFQCIGDQCCVDDECRIKGFIHELDAAEFAVRSQCFSNSRSQQRWQTDDVGFWMMNTHHGVAGDVVVNAGWLAPFLDFELYVQKFDEAVFKGPRLIVTTDEVGQLMVPVPTLVEGDRVMLRAEDSCCDDYTLILPCVPEFTGFAGAPGIPYSPAALGPIPAAFPPPVPGAVPGVVPGAVPGAVIGEAPAGDAGVPAGGTVAPVSENEGTSGE